MSRAHLPGREGNLIVKFTAPRDGYTGAFQAPHGMALEPCGDLVMVDIGNRHVVAVCDALPRCKTWLPLAVRSGGAEQPGRLLHKDA